MTPGIWTLSPPRAQTKAPIAGRPCCLPGHNGAPPALESTLARRGRVYRGRALARYFVVLGAPSRPGLLNMGCSFGYSPPWGLVLKGASWLCARLGLNRHAQVCTHVQTSLCVRGLTCREMCGPSGRLCLAFPSFWRSQSLCGPSLTLHRPLLPWLIRGLPAPFLLQGSCGHVGRPGVQDRLSSAGP